ncbi:MAG: DUF1839 family protein [Rhizobiales bacterium]|nr:DUF1839 family protein [Hyphomicrobiales bacterium]
MQAIPGLRAESYAPHALHGADREWAETNCYVDLWIELLHALGREPRAALGFTVTQDFEGDQFTFFKFPFEDLRALYGAHVLELAVYDDLAAHIERQIAQGRIVLVEMDAFHLPDTRGVSYGVEHSKTTIGINRIDRTGRSLSYFHNAGYFDLAGDDYDALFPAMSNGLPLFPYCEMVKLEPANDEDPRASARALLRGHLARRPRANPVAAFAAALPAQTEALIGRDPAAFHKYAFNTLRQLGANFELLASHLDWLDDASLAPARAGAHEIAVGAKTLQFQLARAVSRRKPQGLETMAAPLADAWSRVMTHLDASLG